jgi:Domain of unknown function (DUF6391)
MNTDRVTPVWAPSAAAHSDAPHSDAALLRQIGFLPGLKEILLMRQVHALEHATVWVLSGALNGPRGPHPWAIDNQSLGGLSTERGFYLYGDVATAALERATKRALRRLTQGEANLATHPRCGTNLTVAAALTVGLTATAHWVLPRDPISQILGLAAATALAHELSPEVGRWVQQHVTTAIPFNLAMVSVVPSAPVMGRAAHFVQVQWRDL